MNTKERTPLDKLKEAWGEIPEGAKAIVFQNGYSHQAVSHILKNGRKDENIILELLETIKKASEEAAQKALEQNNKVQRL
ncbi:hypothetical protein C7S20_19270 [Christiangramia fulva]|uniref:Transcriptional regulator n=1 Tax=Christiangramia fulva TaxID=2126553 RepID=A0A2R3ZAB9_9FLAO|nr:hypothetical protein [Christiangramia fulva]AVR47219.1 hypothetical protein C7S20_19270 [Christiangramia fulva]